MLFHPRIDGGVPLDSAVEIAAIRSLEIGAGHGVLSGIRWFQGATLSSYSMGSPKPSVWTPSWRRASRHQSAMRVECHDMSEDAAKCEGLSRFAQSIDERIIPGEWFRTSRKIRCSSASVFSSLCSITCGDAAIWEGRSYPYRLRPARRSRLLSCRQCFLKSCLRVLFDSRQGSSSTTRGRGRSNWFLCQSTRVFQQTPRVPGVVACKTIK